MTEPALHRRTINRAEVWRIRRSGASQAEVARQLGISKSQVGRILHPDREERSLASGRQYKAANLKGRATCPNCGARTSRQRVQDSAVMCPPCATEAARIWTPAIIVAAIQLYAHRYGRTPGAADWNPAQARANGRDDWAERFERDGDYPITGVVRHHFGSWNAAIAAAGFEPRPTGARGPARAREANSP